jgi:hypothetical protein
MKKARIKNTKKLPRKKFSISSERKEILEGVNKVISELDFLLDQKREKREELFKEITLLKKKILKSKILLKEDKKKKLNKIIFHINKIIHKKHYLNFTNAELILQVLNEIIELFDTKPSKKRKLSLDKIEKYDRYLYSIKINSIIGEREKVRYVPFIPSPFKGT